LALHTTLEVERGTQKLKLDNDDWRVCAVNTGVGLLSTNRISNTYTGNQPQQMAGQFALDFLVGYGWLHNVATPAMSDTSHMNNKSK